MNQFLLLFTVGPVQGFIAQARKTQDFYAGSYILSYLIRIAMQRAAELGAEIVFPDPALPALPNRFLAECTAENNEKVKRLGKELETTVRQEFESFANGVIEKLGMNRPRGFSEQIKNVLEVYWVFMPVYEGGYAETYRKLGVIMGGVKNTRKFRQIKQNPSRRCSLTGEHNVLFVRPKRGGGTIYAPDAHQVKNGFPLKYLSEGEGLGAVSFVKRCADQYFTSEFDRDFDSTAKIALLESFNKLKNIDPSFNSLLESDFDEELIFDIHNHRKPENVVQSELDIARKIHKGLERHKISFSPYYALLIFDGDNMGKWYSEPDLFPGRSLREYHSSLSNRTSIFAQRIKEVVLRPPRGRTVYAGGEDFVGFLNLEHMFPTIQQLRIEFERIDLSDFTDAKLTFSAGIAIAHYKMPLSEVFNWARKMEKQAKSIDKNKDSFGIAVLKHSGEVHQTLLKWKHGDRWSTEILQQLISELKEDKYSTTFIRSFGREFSKITRLGTGERVPLLDEMVKTEIKRLLKRASQTSPKLLKIVCGRPENEQEVAVLAGQLYDLYLDSRSFDNFIRALDIVAFLVRELR